MLLRSRWLHLATFNLTALFQTSSLALPSGLILDPASLELIGQGLATGLLSLGSVDAVHEDTAVLKHITLAAKIELVVEITVDLLCFAILAQEITKDTLATHPQDLLR